MKYFALYTKNVKGSFQFSINNTEEFYHEFEPLILYFMNLILDIEQQVRGKDLKR